MTQLHGNLLAQQLLSTLAKELEPAVVRTVEAVAPMLGPAGAVVTAAIDTADALIREKNPDIAAPAPAAAAPVAPVPAPTAVPTAAPAPVSSAPAPQPSPAGQPSMGDLLSAQQSTNALLTQLLAALAPKQ